MDFTGFPEQWLFVKGIFGCLRMEARCGLQRIIEIGYHIVFCSLDSTYTLTGSGAFNLQVFL